MSPRVLTSPLSLPQRIGLRVEFLWNDALYSTKTHCGVLDVIIELTTVVPG